MKNTVKNAIKEMENQQRQKIVASPKDDVIAFEIWWVSVCKRLNLKSWLKEILWADFKARGLSANEIASKYEEALKKFGF